MIFRSVFKLKHSEIYVTGQKNWISACCSNLIFKPLCRRQGWRHGCVITQAANLHRAADNRYADAEAQLQRKVQRREIRAHFHQHNSEQMKQNNTTEFLIYHYFHCVDHFQGRTKGIDGVGEGKAGEGGSVFSLMRTLNMPSHQGQQRLNSLGQDHTVFYRSLVISTYNHKPKVFECLKKRGKWWN